MLRELVNLQCLKKHVTEKAKGQNYYFIRCTQLLPPLYHRQQQPPEQQPWRSCMAGYCTWRRYWSMCSCHEQCRDGLSPAWLWGLCLMPYHNAANLSNQRAHRQHLFVTSHDAKNCSWLYLEEKQCVFLQTFFFSTANITDRVALLLRKSCKNSEDDCWWISAKMGSLRVCHGMARSLSYVVHWGFPASEGA